MRREFNGMYTAYVRGIIQFPKSSEQASEDSLLWEDLPKFASELGWNLSAADANFFEWTWCHPQYSCLWAAVTTKNNVIMKWYIQTSNSSTKIQIV